MLSNAVCRLSLHCVVLEILGGPKCPPTGRVARQTPTGRGLIMLASKMQNQASVEFVHSKLSYKKKLRCWRKENSFYMFSSSNATGAPSQCRPYRRVSGPYTVLTVRDKVQSKHRLITAGEKHSVTRPANAGHAQTFA